MKLQPIEESIDWRKGQLILYEPCPRCRGQQIHERDSRYDLNFTLCLNCGREQYAELPERKERRIQHDAALGQSKKRR